MSLTSSQRSQGIRRIPEKDIQKLVGNLCTELPHIVTAFENSVSELKDVIRCAKTDLEEICQKDEIKKITEVKYSYKQLVKTIDAAYEYFDKVDDLFWKLERKTSNVIKDLKNHEDDSFKGLIEDVYITIQECKKKYTIFLECSGEFVRSCNRAEAECKRLEEEAEHKKTVAKAVGGTGAAAVAVGGTVASVLVGVFTFGVGFAVGLPLTIAGTVAATGAATGATALVAHYYGKAAESFREMGRRFKSLQNNMDIIEERITSTHEFVTEIKKMTKISTGKIVIIRELSVVAEQSAKFYRKTTQGLECTAEFKSSYYHKVEQTFVAF